MKSKKNDEDIFKPSVAGLDNLLEFLKGKPYLMGKNCQMLTALNMYLHKKDGWPYLLKLIEEMKQNGVRLSDENWHELIVKTMDKYLDKIVKKREWVYSIKDFIRDKFYNTLRTNEDREGREAPFYIKDKDKKDVINPKAIEPSSYVTNRLGKVVVTHINPEAKRVKGYKEVINYLETKEIVSLMQSLSEIEKNVLIYKAFFEYTENEIAEKFNITRDVVKYRYKTARDKIRDKIK